MKKFMMLAALAVALAIGLPSAADAAKVRIGVFFGVPYYSYQVSPVYVYRPGYGWYYPRYRPVYPAYRMSCWQARQQVRARGYHNVAAIECGGRTYTFRATRNGYRVVVYVNARTGAVWRG